MLIRLCLLATVLIGPGCLNGNVPVGPPILADGNVPVEPPNCADGGPLAAVAIGLTDPNTLAYLPLSPGDDIQLETFGQGGNHAAFAVQIEGLGTEAYVEVTITNPLDGRQTQTEPFIRPQPLLCDETGCRLVNLLVRMGGLTDPDQLDPLPVQISVTAHDNGCQTASADIEAVLLRP